MPERSGRGAARPRRGRAGVRAGRSRRLRDHRPRSHQRARCRRARARAARVRVVPARGGGPRRIPGPGDRRARRRDGRNGLPAAGARAAPGRRDARGRHRLRRGRAPARPRRRDRRPRLVGQHTADERVAIAWRPARVRGRPGCPRRRGGRDVRVDGARRRRGTASPLSDAERARVGTRRHLRARRAARAQRRAAGRAWSRGRARARPVGGRLASAAEARGGRRLVDPDPAGRADGGVRTLPSSFAPYAWAPPSDEVARLAGVDVSQVLRFDQNTPPLPLASTRPGTIAGALARVSGYPAGGYRALRRAIAGYAGVGPENVVLGAGADDLILLTARAFAGPGDSVAIPAAPTYPLFRIAADLAGAEVSDENPVLTFA